jgi:hypothetical protein
MHCYLSSVLQRAACLALLACALSASAATTFYVNAANGNDASAGNEEAHPWATLKNLNQHIFDPGDQILLRAGQNWTGTLELHGSGTEDAPIVLGRYGEGDKPLIKGAGAAQTILLSEISYWTLQDIAVTNHGATVGIRNGIQLHVAFKALAAGLHLVRVDIHDVNGEVGSKSSGGIGVMAWGKNGHTARFDDLLIDHCNIAHVDGQGIWFHVKGSRDEDENAVSHDFPNTRIRITGTTIFDTGRNAIFLRDSLNASIDHNTVRSAAARTHGNAIVVAGAKGTVIRNNEVFDTGASGGGENGAFDADDGAINTLIEDNWTHDNAGGSANIVNDPTHTSTNSGTIVRYNLSENEKASVFGLGGNVQNTLIYNNTVFIGKGHSPKILMAGRFVKHKPGDPDGIVFADNVIYSEGGGDYPINATHVLMDANCFFGKAEVLKMDQHKVIGDPGFDKAVLPVTSWKDIDHYRLAKGSACAQAEPFRLPGTAGQNILGETVLMPTRGAAGVAQ